MEVGLASGAFRKNATNSMDFTDFKIILLAIGTAISASILAHKDLCPEAL